MSRKFDRQLKINQEVVNILEDPYTMQYLARKLIRRKPKYLPWMVWKGLLWIVVAPAAKQKHEI